MPTRPKFPFAAGLAGAAMVLAGCLGSSGGGAGAGMGNGNGGGAGAGDELGIRAELNAARQSLVELGGTPNLRELGTASYEGQAMFNLRTVETGAPIIGEARADVALDVDFGATVNPISGAMSNLRGTLDGEPYALPESVTLPVTSSMITRIDLDPSNPDLPPGVGDILDGVPGIDGLEPGGLTVTFSGTSTVEGNTGTSNITLGGGFYGPGEEAIIADGGGSIFVGGEAALIAEGGMFAEQR